MSKSKGGRRMSLDERLAKMSGIITAGVSPLTGARESLEACEKRCHNALMDILVDLFGAYNNGEVTFKTAEFADLVKYEFGRREERVAEKAKSSASAPSVSSQHDDKPACNIA